MPALHDRENIYRFLWENSDRHGFIRLSQQEVSKELGVSFQRLHEIYLEFIDLGRMKKFKNRFQVRDPDGFLWDETYSEQAREFRAKRGR